MLQTSSGLQCHHRRNGRGKKHPPRGHWLTARTTRRSSHHQGWREPLHHRSGIRPRGIWTGEVLRRRRTGLRRKDMHPAAGADSHRQEPCVHQRHPRQRGTTEDFRLQAYRHPLPAPGPAARTRGLSAQCGGYHCPRPETHRPLSPSFSALPTVGARTAPGAGGSTAG